jgi:restriction endonuclease S subunit
MGARSFVIDHKIIQNRWDPNFFKPEYLSAIERVSGGQWPTMKLIELTEKITQGPNPKEWSEDGIPCLKTKNLDSNGWNFKDLDYVPPNEYERLKDFTLRKNDLLVAIVGFGSLGKVGVFRENGTFIFTRALGLIRLRGNAEISPEFLSVFLNTETGQTLLDRGITGSTGQLILTTEYLKNMDIPIPPREIQDRIAATMQEAYRERERLLREADEIANQAKEEAERMIIGGI